MPYLRRFVPEPQAVADGAREERTGALLLLLAVIAFRSIAWFGLVTFVPLYEVSRGHSEVHGNRLLTVMLFAGGVGTLVAGPVADRVGRRPVLMASLVATPLLIVVYVLAGGAVGTLTLALVGVCVIGTFGVTMVMSQEYLPGHVGVASGLSIGLSIGLGGVAAVALGALADSVDLRTALLVSAAAPAAAVVLGALLPPTRPRPRLAPDLVTP